VTKGFSEKASTLFFERGEFVAVPKIKKVRTLASPSSIEWREQDLKAAERVPNAFGRLWPFSIERDYASFMPKKAQKSAPAAS
jgi:hypothetical protein